MDTTHNTAQTPLAIVGMACQLPGANNIDEYWKLLLEGRSNLGELPPERFDREMAYDPKKSVRNKSYTSLGGLTDERPYDPQECPLPPELVAKAHRVHLKLVQVAADAFRHAGIDPFLPPDQANKNVGVYVGHTPPSAWAGEVIYARQVEMTAQYLREVEGFDQLTGGQQDAVIQQAIEAVRAEISADDPAITMFANAYHGAGIISEGFQLDGPSMSFDAACASSLRAFGAGARALQSGQIDMAVIGGASYCQQDTLVLFSQAQSVSPNGSCPFDDSADGLIASEGYVIVLLKTLEKAIADGDQICAVLTGMGISSDGKGKSLWAPRKEGQIEAIRRAYSNGTSLNDLQYIEMHATSTQVGDATELGALSEVLGAELEPGRKIPVGSVKANVGHTLETAGIASLVKAVLALQHKTIPPQINIRKLNTTVDWPNLPFYVPTEAQQWDTPAGKPRRAAVNAFGIGGLNVHLVIDEYLPEASQKLLPASGATPAANANGLSRKKPEFEPIAVVGMGAIAPGARTIESLWDVLASGQNQIQQAPLERWDPALGCEPGSDALWKVPTALGGFITDFEYDWKRHKVPPKQVSSADPLQFMLLDATEQAIRDAGLEDRPFDRVRTGVIVGTTFGGEFADQLQMGLRLPKFKVTLAGILRSRGIAEDQIEAVTTRFEDILLKHMPALIDETGSFTASTLASRITKTFDLMGGATAVDAGDASGFAALQSCIDILHARDCDMMICAAGQRSMGYSCFETLARAGVLTKSGNHVPFDVSTDGCVPGEGVGVVILKRLSDAQRDGDKVHAVIRGMGAARGTDLQSGWKRAMARGLETAGATTDQVSVVETAAAGIRDIDGKEVAAIKEMYGSDPRAEKLAIGGFAGQFGNTGGGSGLLSMIKAIEELNHVQMLPLVGIQQPIPEAGLHTDAAELCLQPEPVRPVNADGRLLAGVNNFGQHKLLYHVVVEGSVKVPAKNLPAAPATTRVDAPSAQAVSNDALAALPADSPWRIIRAASDSLSGLSAQAGQIAASASDAYDNAAGIDTTAFQATDRHRLAIVASSAEELTKLSQLAAKQIEHPQAHPLLAEKGIFVGEVDPAAPRRRVAFLFPGQGSQYTGMLRELVEQCPPAAAALRDVDQVLAKVGVPSFADLAWKDDGPIGADVSRTQLSLLAADMIVYSAATALGLAADRVAGHSFGELVAMAAAGCWSFENAVRATLVRCDSINACQDAGGVMLSTDAPVELVEATCQELSGQIWISHRNSPEQTVVGGEPTAIDQAAERLKAAGHRAKVLDVPAAFHTPLMEGVKEPFGNGLAGIPIDPPSTPLLSSVTNRYTADPQDLRDNLVVQMTQPVQWTELTRRLHEDGITIFVEVGPRQVLTGLHKRILAKAGVTLIGCDHPKRPGLQQLLFSRAALETTGTLDQRHQPSLILGESEPATSAPADDRASEAGFTQSPEDTSDVDQPDGLHILRLAGDPYALGFAHGSAQKQAIRDVLRRYADLAGSRWDKVFDFAEAAAHPEQYFGPAELEELRGIAKGADVAMDCVIAHNLRLFLNAGSGGLHFAVTAQSNPQNGFLHAANEDLQLGLSVRDCLQRNIQVRHPENGMPHLTFAVAGQVGTLNGINACGVAVTSAVRVDVPKEQLSIQGRLHTVLVKNILEQARSVEDAIAIIRQSPGNVAWSLCLSQHSTDRLCYVEFDGRDVRVLPSPPTVVAANHTTMRQMVDQDVPAPPHSKNRLDRLKELLGGDQPKDVSVTRAQEILRDRFDVRRGKEVDQPTINTIRRVDNQISIIMQPGAGKLWVTSGPLANGHQNEFRSLNLAKLLPELLKHGEVTSTSPTADNNGAAAPGSNHPAVVTPRQVVSSYDATQAAMDSGEDQKVCQRFVMRMVPSALNASGATGQLSGPAVVLGHNPVSQALIGQLQQQGLTVYQLPDSEDAAEVITVLEQIWAAEPPRHLILTSAFDADAVTSLDPAEWGQRRTRGVMLPYQVAQRWFQLGSEAKVLGECGCLVVTSSGGDFGFCEGPRNAEGGAMSGLLKGMAMELELGQQIATFRGKVVDFAPDVPAAEVAEMACREYVADATEREVGYIDGQRHVVRPMVEDIAALPREDVPAGAVFVVTGGARGVTAVVARELGKRFGAKLHLLGSSPVPEIPEAYHSLSEDELKELKATVMKEALANGEKPIDAWARFEKGLEIDRTLRSFGEVGVSATYHACDVGNRESLAQVLDQIRAADGPIHGVIHGAGFERASRFERKVIDLVDRTVSAKVDGAAALMSLTMNDPLKLFAAFGSVSGRFGGVGQTDYCMANDMLAKLIDWFRHQRPDCGATVFHWHAWDDVGMAVRPESKHIAKLHDIRFMPSLEGASHLIEDLRAGLPEGEIAVTELRFCRQKYGNMATEETADRGPLELSNLPLLDRVTVQEPGVRQTAEIDLDPTGDVFLMQHRFKGRPMMPVVMTMEAMAEAAALLVGESRHVVGLKDIEIVNGLRFHSDRPEIGRIHTTLEGSDAPSVFSCDFLNRAGKLMQPDRPYLRATVQTAEKPLEFSRQMPPAPAEWVDVWYPEDDIVIYHGPPFRVLRQFTADGEHAWGKIVAPPLSDLGQPRNGNGWMTPHVILDACFFSCGICLWMKYKGAVAIPGGIGGLQYGRLPRPGEECIVHMEHRGRQDRTALFDLTVYGDDGTVIVHVDGYQNVIVAEAPAHAV